MAKTIDVKALKAEIRDAKAALKPLTAAAKAACKEEASAVKALNKLITKLPA